MLLGDVSAESVGNEAAWFEAAACDKLCFCFLNVWKAFERWWK